MREQSGTEVLVVDEHLVVCEGIRAIIGASPGLHLLAQAGSLTEGLALALSLRPDVVLIGLELSDGDAPDLVRQLRRLTPAARCVVMSPVVDDEVFFRCVVAGAVGFLLNDVTPDQLATALRRVGAGETLITTTAIDELQARVRAQRRPNILNGTLTGQEARILAMAVEGATNREIARELALAEKTVRNYMSNILAKAGVRNRTELTAAVIGSSASAPPPRRRLITLPDTARVG